MFARTYFDIVGLISPLPALDRLLNPFRHQARLSLHHHELLLRWTRRAQRQLAKRNRPLTVEMQLYFSCVVKKRVLFHETGFEEAVTAPGGFSVCFRTVEASSCDPVAFARNYPERRQLRSHAAQRMHPRSLEIDFVHGQWRGTFAI